MSIPDILPKAVNEVLLLKNDHELMDLSIFHVFHSMVATVLSPTQAALFSASRTFVRWLLTPSLALLSNFLDSKQLVQTFSEVTDLINMVYTLWVYSNTSNSGLWGFY